MGCCGPEVQERTRRLIEAEGLPVETYLCTARMAYNMVRAAEYFYTGRYPPRWEELPEDRQVDYAIWVQRASTGHQSPGEPLDLLFYSFVRVIMQNI